MIKTLFKHKISLFISNKYLARRGFINAQKEREIIVWLRLQKGLDKPEHLDFIQKKFNIDKENAETLFYKAFPDGLSAEELQKIDEIANLTTSRIENPQEVDELLNCVMDSAPTDSNILEILDSIEKEVEIHPKIIIV